MLAAKKNEILTQFLRSISPEPPNAITVEMLTNYTDLANALDFLEQQAPPVLNFDTLDNPNDWNLLRDVLLYSAKFNDKNPPALLSFSQTALGKRTTFWQRDQQLAGLPQNDFYNRQTQNVVSDELQDLIIASRLKMKPLIDSFLKPEAGFDPANDKDVQSIIKQLETRLKTNPKHSPAYLDSEKKLAILEDLNKINKLAAMSIPQEPGGARNYCSLAESAGGVTEKVSLIRFDKVRTQLTHLTTATISSIDDYTAARANYKLSTEAILKLPKHKDIKEVQREAMALNVSRLLGLDTTRSTIMTHNGQPALFVPFDNIKLLKEFAKGKTLQAAGFSGQTYEHYSTMNPVGRGLQGNAFVDDFGNSLGLFYLCSDTDAVGAYNQNKALRDDRSLFIFDQVIMSKDKLGLDSRLSMQPIEFMVKHTRHGQGRNRTLIEDSSFNSKFDSIMDLKEKQSLIHQYMSRVIHFHQVRIKELEDTLTGTLSEPERKTNMAELKNLLILRDDAVLIRTSINDRIKKIDDVFPKHKAEISDIEVRQAMVLEKLLHNPMLFSLEGRPYRNPWTQRQNNPVKTISELNSTHLVIKFDSKVNVEMFNFIKRHGGGDSLLIHSDKELVISRADLGRLHEAMLHPESQPVINLAQKYLDPDDLKIIGKAYEKGHRGRILGVIDRYMEIMADQQASPDEKFKAIEQAEKDLINHINTAKNPGFGMHVLKKFHYDVQKQLQLMIPVEIKPANLDAAFSAAVKLDRLADFNQVIKIAIQTDKLSSPALTKYIGNCVGMASPPISRNHHEAILRSSELMEAGRATIITFSQAPAPKPSLLASISEDSDEDELADISPVAHRAIEIRSERSLILGHEASSLSSVEEENPKDINYNETRLISS